MTRIYEALEQFDLEQTRETDRSLSVPQMSKAGVDVSPAMTETLIALYRTIFNLLPGPGGRVVQFVETGRGSGCSRIVRAFAQVSFSTLKKSVLLLDSDPQMPSDFDFFNHKSRVSWINGLSNNDDGNQSQGSGSKRLMAVSRLSMESGLLPDNVAPAQTEEFLERLKQTFDLTLIDSWSISIPAKPTLFSPHVDGVVLVIDEGKTRWQIIEQQKRDLISQGANVLGVVLNNRTYPIPDSIYERL